MIYSMTGFGSGIKKLDRISFETEIKSLNSRFLDLSIKLPKVIQTKELEIRELIKNNIKRGKVTVAIHIKKDGIEDNFLNFNKENLEIIVKLLNDIRESSNIEEKLTLGQVLEFQGSFLADDSVDEEINMELIKESLLLAIQDLKSMRKEEGISLANDLKNRINTIKELVGKIESEGRESVVQYFQKLKDRAKQLVKDISEFNDRLEMELALLAEKYDITEECVRLKSHLDIFYNTLNNGDEAGRRLNFICQEMNREANTINSKTVSSDIAHYGISIKEELEKIREQIQNIE
ncbi:MAG: YicC/YloC family endoribonuclease [Ignavibacteria bacterium]|jgi:uncharacterized protein (TIGR00255 family)